MAEVDASCDCQYTLTLTDELLRGEPSEMKDNYNQAPNIHEVDEEDTDEEYANEKENPETSLQRAEAEKNEDEESYRCESFCSEDSCEETDQKSIDSPTLRNESKLTRRSSSRTLESGYSVEESEDEETVCLSRCGRSSSILRHARARRKNMTFTDEEIRKIERENQLLLRKIMAQQRPRENQQRDRQRQGTSSSAINRKNFQRKVEYDNMLLLQRIQQAKSRVMGNASRPGCRLTFL